MTICSVQSIIDFEEHCNLIFDFGKQSEPRICVYTGIFIELDVENNGLSSGLVI